MPVKTAPQTVAWNAVLLSLIKPQ